MPAALRDAEWVGPAVLMFVAIAGWSVGTASQSGSNRVRTRFLGVGAVCCIGAAVWLGIAVNGIFGAFVLGAGCIGSVCAMFVRLGITWRNHVRPSLIPVFLIVCIAVSARTWPRITTVVSLVLLALMSRIQRAALDLVDRQLTDLLTRVLVLTHAETASYLMQTWFARFRKQNNNVRLLALAHRARERASAIPRARSTAVATDSLRFLDQLASRALDERLGTDDAARRSSSWVRVLSKEATKRVLRRSGIVWFLQLISALVLAAPAARDNPWDTDEQLEHAISAPDPEGYVVDIMAKLSQIPNPEELERVRERAERQALVAGRRWLSAVAVRAEQCREEAITQRRDYRIEIVGEVMWGIYESLIGARPPQFDLFDQMRLQAPDLVDGLSVSHVSLEDENRLLLMSLNGLPTTFHELTLANSGGRETKHVVLETRDRRRWVFHQLEAATASEVLFVFERAS